MSDAAFWYSRALFDSARVTGLAPGTYPLRETVRSSGDQLEAYLALTGCGGGPDQRVALPRTGPRDWVQVALSTDILAGYGVSYARLKVWVNPADGADLDRRSRRRRGAGRPHLGERWGEPDAVRLPGPRAAGTDRVDSCGWPRLRRPTAKERLTLPPRGVARRCTAPTAGPESPCC